MQSGRRAVEPDEQKEERSRALERRALSARAVHEALRSEGDSEIGWVTYLWRYGIPVLLGNSIGGIVLVAVLNHAQVVAEERP